MRIVVLVSGNGSNLQALIDACEQGRIAGRIVGVVSNRAKAFALQRAERHGIPTSVVRKFKAQSREAYDAELADAVAGFEPELVVLAGFMRVVTPVFIGRFERLINLHPALPGELPGTEAIQRAWESDRTVTGVMVHEVVEEIDAGPVLGVREVEIDRIGTLEQLEAAMHAAEHELLVEVVARLALGSMIPLTRTDHALATSVVRLEDGAWVVRTEDNPTFRWGNHLWLPGPPTAASLLAAVARFRELFPGDFGVCLRWDGPAPTQALVDAAAELGLRADSGLEMVATEITVDPSHAVSVLDFERDGAEIDALNRICDPQEGAGDASYDGFKRDLRTSWRHRVGARWWGIRVDGELVAQCGLVPTALGGRFQSIETHPDHRRQGLCTSLVAAVAELYLVEGAPAVFVGVEPDGAARRVYARVGFVDGGWQHALMQR